MRNERNIKLQIYVCQNILFVSTTTVTPHDSTLASVTVTYECGNKQTIKPMQNGQERSFRRNLSEFTNSVFCLVLYVTTHPYILL